MSADRDDHASAVSAPGFVGRSRELAALADALANRPAVVLVEGEAGIGKSRLLGEFTARLATSPSSHVGDPDPEAGDFSTVVAVDEAGNAHVASGASPGSVVTTPDAYQSQCQATACLAIAAYGPTGTLTYSSCFGTSGDTEPTNIALDDSGRTYVTGFASSDDELPVTPGAFSTTHGDGWSFFVAAFGKGTLLYSSYFGGTSSICVPPLCGFAVGSIHMAPHVDSGTLYLGGTTANPNMPVTPGAFQTAYPGGFNNIFAAKLSLPDFGATAASAPSPLTRR